MPIENRAIAEAQERVKTIDSQIEHEQEMQSTQRTALNKSIERERELQALKADWLAILEHECRDGAAARDLSNALRRAAIAEAELAKMRT